MYNFFFRILWWIGSSKEQLLSELDIFCNIIHYSAIYLVCLLTLPRALKSHTWCSLVEHLVCFKNTAMTIGLCLALNVVNISVHSWKDVSYYVFLDVICVSGWTSDMCFLWVLLIFKKRLPLFWFWRLLFLDFPRIFIQHLQSLFWNYYVYSYLHWETCSILNFNCGHRVYTLPE